MKDLMKKTIGELVRNEKGLAFVAVLGLLIIGGLTIFPLLIHMSTGLKAGQIQERKVEEIHAADAGVEYAMWDVIHGELEIPEGGQSVLPNFTMNEKMVNVTLNNTGEQKYRIISKATSNYSSSTVIEAYVEMPASFNVTDIEWQEHAGNLILEPGEEYTGDVHAEGNIQLGEDAVINGHCQAEGNVQLDAGAIINGNVICEGNVQIQMEQGAVINGGIISGGAVQVVAYGVIEGNVIGGGDVQPGPSTTIKGGVCSGGNVQLGQDGVIQGNVHAVQNVELGIDATIEGDVYTGGIVTLGVGAQILGDYPLPYEGCPLYLCGGPVRVLNWLIK